MALVSQYDNFLGLLIETILLSRPEILNGSEKTLSFSELVAFDSIEAAREHIIEKEVESVLRENHAEQFDWLERKFKTPLREGLSIWPSFIEVTERRNLFVHTGGQISGQYLKVCQTHKVDCGDISKGGYLGVSTEYFEQAHEIVFEVGVKLAHVLWRKMKPDDREKADRNLLRISYDLLCQEKNRQAIAILDFATDVLKKLFSAEYKLSFVVNRAQAYKWSGDNDHALQILDNEDFSAVHDKYRLAEAVLRENYKKAFKLVRSIGAHGEIDLAAYREWPLFREFRKQKELETVIREIFSEPLNKVSVKDEAPCLSEDIEHTDTSIPNPEV